MVSASTLDHVQKILDCLAEKVMSRTSFTETEFVQWFGVAKDNLIDIIRQERAMEASKMEQTFSVMRFNEIENNGEVCIRAAKNIRLNV